MGYKLTIEVPLLLCYFGFMLVGNITVNLYMFKVCYNILEYPEVNCSRLGRYDDNDTKALENIVQPKAGVMTILVEMIPITVPVVLSLMLGSWSDKHGRKPVLLFSLICLVVGMTMTSIMLAFKDLNPWWLMLASIPLMLCGGITTFFTVTLSYLNDTSTPDNKFIRMVTFDVVQGMAALGGGLCSSYLFYATNYPTVYGISALLIATGTVYTFFYCPESLKNKSEEKEDLKRIFDFNLLKDIFEVALKKREHNKRSIIFLSIFALTLTTFVTIGESNVKVLYLRKILSWSLTKRNVFGAWSGVVGIICTGLSTYLLHKKLKTREVYIIILSLLSMSASSLLYAFGNSEAYIYSSVLVGVFNGIGTPMLRTILAKILLPDEMGKIFSFVMVLNSFNMLISSMLYVQIYNSTLDTHPESFNYFSIALYAVVLVTVIIIMNIESRILPEDVNQEKGEFETNKSTQILTEAKH